MFRRVADDARIDYRVTRHAPVRGDDDVLWVSIARWVHTDGRWCLEYWDDVGEADHDLTVPDEAAAVQRAREEFGIEAADWRLGPQPWGRPNDS
jgi:hypothetical protein